MLKGIDVSEHQGRIDWRAVKNAGIKFAIIRAGYGSNTVDEQFYNNANGCTNVGIPFGLYWFSYAYTVDMARQEAQKCISLAKKYNIEYPICYDLEYDTLRYANDQGITIGMTLASQMADAFLTEIKKAGYKAMIYTNQDYYLNMFNSSVKNKYDLWYAWYNNNLNRKCTIWQYSESGSVSGIGTNSVDMNYSYVDYSKNNNVNNREEDEKVKNIVCYGYGIDKNAAEYLGDFLSCSTIETHRPYDYSHIENVYAIGGSKGSYTGYLDTLITGSSRYDTFERVIDYILAKKGVKASNSSTVSQKEKQAKNRLVIYNNYVDKRAAEYLAYKLDCPLKENRNITVKDYDFVYLVGGGNTPSGVKGIKGDDRYLTAKAVIDFMKKL